MTDYRKLHSPFRLVSKLSTLDDLELPIRILFAEKMRILERSVVTQTMLGGLAIYPRVANFLQCIRAKNYENWLAVDKVIAKISRLAFFGPPCMSDAFLADAVDTI